MDVEQIASALFGVMGRAPAPLIYVIAAVWLGLESAGIGVPIELMLLFVGSLAAQGTVNPFVATLCTAVGSLLFASLAYVIGRRAGTPAIARVGKYIGLTQVRADHIEAWLRRRGAVGVMIARETPIIRTFGSYVMGAARIPALVFALSTLAGSLLYCGVFIGLGVALGANYKKPLHALDQIGPIGILAFASVALVVIAIHYAWGRFSVLRLARHFQRYARAVGAALAVPVAPAAATRESTPPRDTETAR